MTARTLPGRPAKTTSFTDLIGCGEGLKSASRDVLSAPMTKRRWLSAQAVGLMAMLTVAVGAARADDIAYTGVKGGNFGTVDLNTGVYTTLGSSGQTLAGMAVANATLFATSYHVADSLLFSVNPTNGSLTTIGLTGVNVDDFGSTTAGLYAVDISGNLDAINPTTGAATLIGAIGIGFGSWRSLSTNSSTLYFSNGADLYTLSTSTGAATLVGPTGGPEMGALVFEDGTLYGGQETGTLSIATLSTSTGAATTGSAFTGTGTNQFWALAPNPIPVTNPIPEPATYVLVGLGLAGIGWSQRRRMR
jgi:hypothetical protein